MDTITHFAAGACMGELMAGRRIGKKALAVGGLMQLVPDIDFIFGLWMSPAANALAHRGLTHSLLFLVLITPAIAWTLQKRWPVDRGTTLRFWILFVGAEILAHLLLDAFNAYGTGWFEPFSHRRISFNAVFVADPFFSVPLGLGFLALLLSPMQHRWRRTIAGIALCVSASYLAYGLYNKMRVDDSARMALKAQHISIASYFTTPTPFNNWLWYVVATDATGSYVGYRSVFDRSDSMSFEFFPKNEVLLTDIRRDRELGLLKRFSQGHYTVEHRGDTLIFNDLRFGQMLGWQHSRAGFVFHYYLRPDLDNTLVLQRGRFDGWDKEATTSLIRRAFSKAPHQP